MAFKKLKYWFDIDLAKLLSKKLCIAFPEFDQARFIKKIDKGVNDLELKDRMAFFADELHLALGGDYKKCISILLKILGTENEKETGMFTDFYWVMPIASYVEKYGLDDFKESMHAIEEITKRNTGEYTIRPFIELYQDKTLKQMKKWSLNKNSHVRRLSSEGLRPRLPWAKKLDSFIHDPKPIIPILENLKDDPSKYVQKSVANCINDILKDNLDLAKQLIESWNHNDIGKERKWIIKHALRNLVKAESDWAKEMIA